MASVGPYAFTTSTSGRAARTVSTTPAGSASPANTTVPAAGSAGTPAAARRSMTAASTDGTALTSDHPGSPASARASASSRTSIRPPQASGANSSNTETSKLSDVESGTCRRRCGPSSATAHSTSSTALPWLTTTPLGRPVEPEV
ncbi:hypothetical protein BJF78_15410 [Pseudonocardia sp. CNS-139]|nr:hypothetical protein BJF78_15410 [Pseudonocardia sp. CNS-139]